jgi:P27 family predicted phage terminase small subunit
MPAGRPKKDAALERLEGSPGHRRDKPEVQFSAGAPTMPEGLPELAESMWLSLVKEFEDKKVLQRVDGGILEGACRAYARAVECDRFIDEHGCKVEIRQWDKKAETFVVISEQVRPEVTISEKAWARFYSFIREYGCSPASRSKVPHAAVAAGEAIDETLNGNWKPKAQTQPQVQ